MSEAAEEPSVEPEASARSPSYSSRLAFSAAPWEGSAHKVQPPPALALVAALGLPQPCASRDSTSRPIAHAMRSTSTGGGGDHAREVCSGTVPEQLGPLRDPDRTLAGAVGACRWRQVAGLAAHASQGSRGPEPGHGTDTASEPARRPGASGSGSGGVGPRRGGAAAGALQPLLQPRQRSRADARVLPHRGARLRSGAARLRRAHAAGGCRALPLAPA